MSHTNHRRGETRATENLGRRRDSSANWWSCNVRRNGWVEGRTRPELAAALAESEMRADMAETPAPTYDTYPAGTVYHANVLRWDWWSTESDYTSTPEVYYPTREAA
jgi:hypothetical protein